MLDPSNIKAQLLTGEVLLDIAVEERNSRKIEAAIDKLKKTLSMSQGIKTYETTLQEKIYRARKNLWEVNLAQQIEKKRALKSFLTVRCC